MIYVLPIGDLNTASSRLRIWNIMPYIDSTPDLPEHYEKGDVLIIQKVPDREAMRKAQNEGAKVIYDIDDLWWDKVEFYNMVQNADLVTTDTEAKKKMLGFCGNKSRLAVVVPDSLDWDGVAREEQPKNGIIGWTGYGNNSVYLNDIKDKLPKEYTLRLIAPPDWWQYLKDEQAEVQCRPWSLEMVDSYLRECELSLYYLPERDFEQVKGMHKLLKSWASKVPCYTSRMPDYVKAMEEAGVGEKYLVDDWSKLKNIGFDERCYEYALKYEAKNVAEQWKKAYESV